MRSYAGADIGEKLEACMEGDDNKFSRQNSWEKCRERGRVLGVTCIYFNARYLMGKTDGVRAWTGTCNWDIVVITETW